MKKNETEGVVQLQNLLIRLSKAERDIAHERLEKDKAKAELVPNNKNNTLKEKNYYK